MAIWKYSNKEVTNEDVEKVLHSLVCFNCGKEAHTDECPIAKLRAELKSLKTDKSA